jgi:hypothetical protein
VTRQNQLNRRGSYALDDIQIFFARNSEDAVDTFVLECGNEEIRTFGPLLTNLSVASTPSNHSRTSTRGS